MTLPRALSCEAGWAISHWRKCQVRLARAQCRSPAHPLTASSSPVTAQVCARGAQTGVHAAAGVIAIERVCVCKCNVSHSTRMCRLAEQRLLCWACGRAAKAAPLPPIPSPLSSCASRSQLPSPSPRTSSSIKGGTLVNGNFIKASTLSLPL